MLGFLSWVGMMFVDRLFLGMYTPEALNAAVNAGTFAMGVTFGIDQLVRITGIFVARRNGAGKQDKLGEPVWQGIWISTASLPIFYSLAIWGGALLFDNSAHGLLCQTYFRWFMCIGPLMGFQAALSSYFIGQGRMAIVGVATVFGNLLNLVLDPLFIWGYSPIPSMGMVGAIVATGIGTSGQVLLLLFTFLRKREREAHGTTQWRLNPKMIREMIRVGTPSALFLLLELIGSGLFFSMMASISPEYLLVAGVHQSLFILLLFFGGGMEHGAQTLAGNLIGAGKSHEIKGLLKAGLSLHLIFALTLSILTWFFGGYFVDLLLQDPGSTSATFTAGSLEWVYHTAWLGLGWLVLRLLLETSAWLFNGVLRAAGDTLYPMVFGVLNIWIGLLLPTYFLMVKHHNPMQTAFYIWALYGLIALAVSSARFARGKWKTKSVLSSI